MASGRVFWTFIPAGARFPFPYKVGLNRKQIAGESHGLFGQRGFDDRIGAANKFQKKLSDGFQIVTAQREDSGKVNILVR